MVTETEGLISVRARLIYQRVTPRAEQGTECSHVTRRVLTHGAPYGHLPPPTRALSEEESSALHIRGREENMRRRRGQTNERTRNKRQRKRKTGPKQTRKTNRGTSTRISPDNPRQTKIPPEDPHQSLKTSTEALERPPHALHPLPDLQPMRFWVGFQRTPRAGPWCPGIPSRRS